MIRIMLLFFCASLLSLEGASTFTLRGVRSSEPYGPFDFRSGTLLKLESGVFRLQLLEDAKAFTLVGRENGTVFGVYELVLGRMIDIGDVLFVITGVNHEPRLNRLTEDKLPSFLNDTALMIDFSLLHETPYKWSIDGADGGDRKMDRRMISIQARKGLFTLKAGLVTDSEWKHQISGGTEKFDEAVLVNGSGWYFGAGIRAPVFREGRWSAHLQGETAYRREELSLQYGGAWEVDSITSMLDTNSVTNMVTTVTSLRYQSYDKSSVLTDMQVSIGAQLTYHAPYWFCYGGVRFLPWSETTLDAVISVDDRKHKIVFERKDPIMAYGGIGLDLFGVRTYVELEGGGENVLRLGLARVW